MSRATQILTFTCAGLSVATAYLAYELHAAREELAAKRVTPAPLAVRRDAPSDLRATTPGVPVTANAPSGGEEPARPAAPSKKEMDAAVRAGQYQANAHMRRILNDPELRAKMERDTRKDLEKELTPIALSLDLTEDEKVRLIDVMTGLHMRYADTVSRCAETPGCDVYAVGRSRSLEQQRELTDLMGAEKAQRFADYRDNFMERNSVAAFRAELPDRLQLSDTQAERLANALGDERRHIVKEWEQRGAGAGGMASSLGYLQFPSNTRNIEERAYEASEYQRRQRERAAEFLSAAQLEVFAEQQRELLDVARSGWEAEERTRDTNPN